jgi:hypothetical protein
MPASGWIVCLLVLMSCLFPCAPYMVCCTHSFWLRCAQLGCESFTQVVEGEGLLMRDRAPPPARLALCQAGASSAGCLCQCQLRQRVYVLDRLRQGAVQGCTTRGTAVLAWCGAALLSLTTLAPSEAASCMRSGVPCCKVRKPACVLLGLWHACTAELSGAQADLGRLRPAG